MPPDSPTTKATAVRLRDVTKTYTIWDDPSARLLALVKRGLGLRQTGKSSRQFTAVQSLSLEIAKGDCLGIIGRNGAGKSTLLQMIAGTLSPTSGEVEVKGRVAALLELGSGFNPDFSGRENVYLNASIMGLGKEEIDTRFESIVAYSGIEEFIDQPVRTYSSGMGVRLAFAVCAHVDADIFIIDEALAVGDARFQFKCHATLDKMREEGRTIIFVSHDTNSVKRMCNSAILLERGEVLLQGSPNDVANIYTKLITSPHGVAAIREDIANLKANTPLQPAPKTPAFGTVQVATNLDNQLSPSPTAANLLEEERAHQQISDKEYTYGGDLGQITSVTLCDANDSPRLSHVSGSLARVRITGRATADISAPIYAVTLKDVRGQEIFGTNTYFQNQTPPDVAAGRQVEVTFDIQLNMQPGVYFISVGWVRLENGEVSVIHRRYDAIRFDVLPCDKSFGLVWCPAKISVHPAHHLK